MSGRLWYPQLDVYDGIRRISGLLAFWSRVAVAPSPERLFIADFYLANPPLLHKTHMTHIARKEFNGLDIHRPEKSFVSYPSSPILFQKMEQVQRQAFRTLTGKGLIDLPTLESGKVSPSAAGRELFEQQFVPLFGEEELKIAKFIVSTFTSIGDDDIGGLRKRTGLRRIVR